MEKNMVHTIKLRDDYIKLGQALKAAGLVENGVDACLLYTSPKPTRPY